MVTARGVSTSTFTALQNALNNETIIHIAATYVATIRIATEPIYKAYVLRLLPHITVSLPKANSFVTARVLRQGCYGNSVTAMVLQQGVFEDKTHH